MVPTPAGIEFTYKIPGIVKLLFETPSGFAIFSFDEKYLDKDIEHLWAYFVGKYWHQNIIWLHEFQKFEDKSDAIDLTNRKIGKGLNMMLLKYCYSDDKLIVGSLVYKEIIEGSLGLTCVYNDVAVTEVMWGLQNLMHTLVPQEQSEISKEDQLPSHGLNMVLDRHGIVVKKEMINERIIEKTHEVYYIDLRQNVHSNFLHERLAEDFKTFSKVDIEKWSLFKLATALKLMFDPHGGLKAGDAYEMFSRAEFTMMERDAPRYQGTISKDTILVIYNDVVTLREDKIELLYELDCLVEEAKAALETEEAPEKLATNGVDSKQQVDHTCLTGDLTVPNQSSIDEGQRCRITDADGREILPPSNSADPVKNNSLLDSMRESEVHTSSIFSVAPQVVPTSMYPTSQEINALSTSVKGKMQEKKAENTSVKQMDAISDEDNNVEKITAEGKKQAQETSAKGRNQTEGVGQEAEARNDLTAVESVDNLKEKEHAGNTSVEQQTNAIRDGVRNDPTEVECVDNLKEKQAKNNSVEEQGNAILDAVRCSVNQNGTLNADDVEGKGTEDTSAQDAVQYANAVEGQKHAQQISEEERNALQLTNNGEGEGIVGQEGNKQNEDIAANADDAVEGKQTEDTSTQDAAQDANDVEGQKHTQGTSAEWTKALQHTNNGEGGSQAEGIVSQDVNEQKENFAATASSTMSSGRTSVSLGFLLDQTRKSFAEESEENKTSTKDASSVNSVSDASSARPPVPPNASPDDQSKSAPNNIDKISNKRKKRWTLFSCLH